MSRGVYCIILVLFSISNLFAQSANIELLSNVVGGSGTYDSPYLLDTNVIEWTHNVSGSNKESASYMTCVHAAIGRSCIVAYQEKDINYLTMEDKIYSITEFCGTYYIRTEVNGSMTSKIFILCQVPPVESFNVPYTPPASNVPPTPVIDLKNILGGSGTYNSPYVIAGSTVQFYIKDSNDGNGKGDLEKGAWYWAIVTDGWHPIYSKGQELKYVEDTYAYYDEFNDLQQWDTTERPSNTGDYKLTLYLYDRHGVRNTTLLHFTCDETEKPPPPQETDDDPPEPPRNVTVTNN